MTMPTNRRPLVVTMILASCSLLALSAIAAEAAAAHQHQHTQHSRERLEDGSYAPRDAGHHSHGDHSDSEELHHSEFDHEAILGSVRAAEEFDQLPPAEAKKRLAVLVREMDLNHDAFIDRHELKAWILRSFRKLAEEESAERFDEVDINRDGVVTWQEYVLETYNMSNETDVRRDDALMAGDLEGENKLVRDDAEMFAAADTDGNDRLSNEEYVAFTSPEEFAHMLPVVLKQTLREKDLNGDGRIDFQEFVADTASKQNRDWLVAEKDRFDEDFDKDGDGLLNGNEILSWVVPSHDEVATEEVDHLFVAADEDHDNRLSYKEIIDQSETFVGSEATDYGEHLNELGHVGDEL